NILVNVVDDREACGFLFPALVKEGKLTVGISTEGASPQMAAHLRSRTAQELPGRMEEILDYLARLRTYAGEKIADSHKRAGFLKKAAVLCMEKDRPLSEEETEELCLFFTSPCQGDNPPGQKSSLREDLAGEDFPQVDLRAGYPAGDVTLVGAGCGAFDLITVKGLNAVRNAQVLVYDDLMDTRLLSHAPESCEKIYVGKRRGRHSMSQEEINDLLVEKAKQGKNVVRLKGGDPFVFGRGGEETTALKREGIEVREIPGISSSIGVPALAGIPVTCRGMSRSFHVITGHTAAGGEGLPENLDTLAALEGTLVVLMGLKHLGEIAGILTAHGKSPRTPAAVVQGGFKGSVQTVRGTLGDIAEKAEEAGIKSPAVIVIGQTAGMDLFS
ncbi:MAG: uroporphyrinogen-III C-methyltransferase, partial [Lachnospiraceae bacterium]|nr:uroporphyrinogen-III C-methyltransferase [Lachnospiraceae bacterium]